MLLRRVVFSSEMWVFEAAFVCGVGCMEVVFGGWFCLVGFYCCVGFVFGVRGFPSGLRGQA